MTEGSNAGYIGPGLALRGRLLGEGDMQIDGRAEGAVETTGHLGIGEAGRVEGPVTATLLEVSGRVIGDVVADSVVVREHGRIDGDVRAAAVQLDDGGQLHGLIHMDFDLSEEWTNGGVS